MKKLLFSQEGTFIAFVDQGGSSSVTFDLTEPPVEYFVDDDFLFDQSKKYSLVDGELQIEDVEIIIPPEPEPIILTPQQKLEQAGLTVDELKELLGL